MKITRVEGDLKEPLPDYELSAVQQGVIARNALARSAEVEIARSQYLLRRAEVEPFPNLNMMGGYQNELSGATAPQNQAIYQVQMVIPLWNRNQGNIRAAQAGVSTAVAQWNRVQTELANATAAALGRYQTARQLAERYEREILPGAVRLQDISLQLYDNGEIGFLNYLTAQRALLDANLAYIAAQESRWTAAAEVAGLLQSERFP
jgi:cobalt-zinc-cadmium efflux system outer membrane protein